MVETKEISELTRSNRIAMLAHISTVTVIYDMGKRKRTTVSGIYDNRYGRWCHTFDWRGDLLEK